LRSVPNAIWSAFFNIASRTIQPPLRARPTPFAEIFDIPRNPRCDRSPRRLQPDEHKPA
jgi:hypothetical protein